MREVLVRTECGMQLAVAGTVEFTASPQERTPLIPSRTVGKPAAAVAVGLTLLVTLAACARVRAPGLPGAEVEVARSSRAAPAPLVTVPIRTDFGLPFVEVEVEGATGRETGRFLVDTGFDVNIIDAAWAARLGVSIEDPQKVLQPGGEITMGRVPGLRLRIGDLEIEGQGAESAPIEGLGGVVGLQLHGVLGHALLDEYVVRIDYAARRMSLFASGVDLLSAEPDAGWRAVPVRIEDGEVLLTFSIEQRGDHVRTGELKLDTGSFGAVGFALNFYESAELERSAPKWRSSLGVGAGGDTEARVFEIDQLDVLRHTYRDIPAGATMAAAGTERRSHAGTVGAPILSRQTLVLDYPRQRLLVGPEYAPGSPIAADHSGLWLVSQGRAFDEVTVHQVLAESPAALAGLRAGDRVLRFDGVDAAGRGLGEWYLYLQRPAGTRVRLDVARGQEHFERTLVLSELF